MNVMVFNVPAETVGALTILNEFYDEVLKYKGYDIKWTFVLSKPTLMETENVKVIRFPWIKKSWAHRLFFDHIIAPKLIKKHKIDKIISFQNVVIPHVKKQQILYVHNSLPFIDHKFTFKKNTHLWIYQNVISKNIIKSIKIADKVIVQTKWMKKACLEKSGVKQEKISVVPPKINFEIKQFFDPNISSMSTFFYPASGFEYKNHKVVIEACKILKNKTDNKYKFIFTLNGKENEEIKKLHEEVINQQLPIEFIGSISREKVFKLYANSVLLFPSYIETFGLPLLEARLHKGMIIASDCTFSNEILNGYENAFFFPHDVPDKLSGILLKVINGDISYKNPNNIPNDENLESLLYHIVARR
ncbi:glycosyltransferase [Neobacillus sp. OS1-2]|uniref:glycosyltransferase n=1 Tax=Neobacillus sp. OS1-2 TaxID=3070680 RepID=UPI0027E045C9|nr:glycosyltransferase [Neobacillus sp. OS1-2]WML41541.1 glycosyltransferase [Neobacillus sp. OS1-2]